MHIALITTDILFNMPIGLYQWVEQTFGPWQPTSVTKWISTFLYCTHYSDLIRSSCGRVRGSARMLQKMCWLCAQGDKQVSSTSNATPILCLMGSKMTSNLNLTFNKLELVDFHIHHSYHFQRFQRTTTNPSLTMHKSTFPPNSAPTYLLSQHQNKDWLTLWKLTDSRDPSSQKAAPWQGRLW